MAELAFASWRERDRSCSSCWSSIHVVDVDGSHEMQLTGAQFFRNPTWSPDGKKIAFVNNGSLLVMNTDGNDQLELRKHSSAWAAWSPDGSRVVFCRGTQIFVMDASGANASPLGEGFGEDYQPAWGKK